MNELPKVMSRESTPMRKVDPLQGRIVWLASYPRSGNTFLRIVLKEVFGLASTSIYLGEDQQFSDKDGVLDKIGHLEDPVFGFKPVAIKTHEPPQDDSPAIYVVRDGRSALASYFHYLNNIALQEVTLPEVLEGATWAGSWTEHFLAWSPETRGKTLIVRYESLVEDLSKEIKRIEAFLELKADRYAISADFTSMQKMYPSFFRVGSNAPGIRELMPYAELFNEVHGELMLKLGYFLDETAMRQWGAWSSTSA